MPNATMKGRFRRRVKIRDRAGTTTYSAVDGQTGKQCIIKVFSLADGGDWATAERFEGEARLLKHLNHSNIPKYIDFFIEDDVRYCIVQEHVEGKTLSEWMADGRRFTGREAIDIATAIAETLAYLHGFSPPSSTGTSSPKTLSCRRKTTSI